MRAMPSAFRKARELAGWREPPAAAALLETTVTRIMAEDREDNRRMRRSSPG